MSERRPEIVDFRIPTVALVGRVNVGKSALFNCIMEQRLAIVSDVPGTTRTRNIGNFTWRGVQSRIVDAGGITFDEHVDFEEEILEQTRKAIAHADVILFVVDARDGLMPQERQIARLLHKVKIPVLLVANKVDAPRFQSLVHEKDWLKLGFGTPRAISAANGVGVGDMLDEIFKLFNKAPRRPKVVSIKPDIRVAILGKPNVGKSTLINQISGEDLVITSPIPHTTRETFNLMVQWHDRVIEFIDTAGIRRKSHVSEGLEKIGVSQSIVAMEGADIVLLMIDATEPVSTQEKVLASLIEEKKRSVVLVVNKWDAIEDHSEENRKDFVDMIRGHYPHLQHAEIVFVSAQSGYRVHQLYDVIVAAFEARHRMIDALTIDEFLRKLISKHPPKRGGGNIPPKIYGIKQLATDPPYFQISITAKSILNQAYVKFIERALREEFGFVGTPIALYTKKTKQ
ncbi:MAG: ribosome biogenesis GTPase Der [Candidatus Magasanikbacteria bacterium RIFCSPHIGHO2_02_FULL_50_9b]|uniref:GTPase Der n=1 Tax=Candidatus Magasanikbacteria bacterium RIFCSPHIGHO2_02_FULL_50_9b TaxID=1798682 RepID=A0A1F6M780_9BACT|nr:MAG: ribosome biogenesis GTPase Der [Candidatus Magasanikbacteria bacterium RIFCSPHIGHO2_02_FULL_50_9b]